MNITIPKSILIAVPFIFLCPHFGFGDPSPQPPQLEKVVLQQLESRSKTLLVSFSLDQPTAPARARFFLDVDAMPSGEAATGADFLLEGETWFSYSGKDGSWDWSPVSKATVHADGNTLHFLIEQAPAFEQARWLAQTTTESWEIADQYPESGMKKVTRRSLSVLSASELESIFPDFTPATQAGDSDVRDIAGKPNPVDLSDLLAHLPVSLSPRLDAETARQTWVKTPAGGDQQPSWTPSGWSTSLPLAFTLKDVVTGEEVDLKPHRKYESESGQRWSGEALGVSWDIFTETDEWGDLQLTGRVQAESDRCIRIGAGCRLDPKGWIWHDDFRFRRTMEDSDNPYRNTGPSFFGYAGEQSLYPFGVISKENKTLVIETDPYEPRICQIYAETKNDFFGIYYDLGLTPETKKFPGTATFRCVLRSMAQGGPASFRRTLSAFYGRSPEFQKSRTGKAGLWMPFSDISKIPGAEDFGFAFFEKGTGALKDADYIREQGVLSLAYTEPWLHWLGLTKEMGWTDDSAHKQMEFLASNGDAQANRFSSASLLGAVRKPDGTILMSFHNTPWSNGARMEVNTDPELPTTKAYPVNRAMAEWVDIQAAITKGQSEGIYLDSMSAMQVLNYDRRAMAVSDIPCTFDMQTLKPGLAAPLANVKFTAALSGYLRQEGKYLMGNFPCWNHPFFMPYIDIPGEETCWYAGGQYQPMSARQLNFRRAISGHKPYGFLQATFFNEFKGDVMERYFKDCLFYAFQPSFFSHDAANDPYWENATWLERDRHFFTTYMPYIQRLARAGWEPDGPVSIASETIWGEQFGKPDDGVFFFTLRNDHDALKTAGLMVNGLGKDWICYDPFNGRVNRLLPDTAGISKINLALRTKDVGLIVFVRLDRLTEEIGFLKKWKADHGLASLNVGNLQSLERETKRNILCRDTYPEVSFSGSSNNLSVHIANNGSLPATIADIKCSAALSASMQKILPGEAAVLEGIYHSSDVDAQGRIAFSCRCKVGDEWITIARSSVPLFTQPVEVVARDLEVFTLQTNAVIDLKLHNHMNQPAAVRIEWMRGKENGVLSSELGSLESRTESLVVPAASAVANPVRVSVFTGELLLFEEVFAVTRLPEGSSLARDSRVKVTVDSTFSGYNLKPLTDGRVSSEGVAWNNAAWASAESSLPHWVRISFPEPLSVSSVVLHWSGGNTSRLGAVRGILESGESVVLASYTNAPSASKTELDFEAARVDGIEVYQPGGAGSEDRPNLLWLREVEVH